MTGAAAIGTAEAHAKVNLRLRVSREGRNGLPRRGDPARPHEPVRHGDPPPDRARAGPSGGAGSEDAGRGVALSVDGPLAEGVPDGPDNLCRQAAERFFERAFGRRKWPAVHIRLTKRIPMGSGLGGGSADASRRDPGAVGLASSAWPETTSLPVLARHPELSETRELVALAGEIGSDVPFALLDVPMALGWERGRRLLPLRPPRPRPALLVCPVEGSTHVSTPEAYDWLGRGDEDAGAASVLPERHAAGGVGLLERLARNDLEAPVLARHPELSELLDGLGSCDPALAAMTGSGSTLFAIFRDEAERARARRTLAASDGAEGPRILDVALPV